MRENETELAEIRAAEARRAQTIREDDRLEQWVKQLRKKYIADGFLTPFYARDGKFSRPRQRIKEFGNILLTDAMVGKVFHPDAPGGRILQETMWFWHYLVYGQKAMFGRQISSLPNAYQIKSRPADKVWDSLLKGSRQLGLGGENGGGVMFSSDQLDERKLGSVVSKTSLEETEDGYLEPYEVTEEPLWITLFRQYEEYPEAEIETRPAWFHLANHAFFNAPIARLPVFLCAFKKGKIYALCFLDEDLSDHVRSFIGKELLDFWVELKSHVDSVNSSVERNAMIWWLWHYVGHPLYRRPVSYGHLSHITRKPRSSIQSSVESFHRKMKKDMDKHLLGRLLRIAGGMRLEYNAVYKILEKQGLVPARDRDIDGFDDIDNLI